jgi:ABC-2 type transport system ATP-binding protein
MEYAAVVENLTRTFGEFTAVDRVSFRVQTGEIFGFLGPNGAGKSTTIRMLNGILMPTSGDARILGFDVYTQVEDIKENIGYMSQKFSLYDDLTVLENIEFYGGIYRVPKEHREKRYRWALDMAGLRDKKDTLTGSLPVGWKQRLALGCAVLHEPKLLFLDEPTSGVDPASRRDFWELIGSMAESGTTVFVTTHYMDEAEHCDRLGLIYKGRLITIGTPEELKKSSMPGTVLEIQSDRALEAVEAVEDLEGVLEAAVFGRNIHVVVEDRKRATSVIKKTCAAQDIDILGIEAIEPSLEDVFVSLIYREDMTNGAAD